MIAVVPSKNGLSRVNFTVEPCSICLILIGIVSFELPREETSLTSVTTTAPSSQMEGAMEGARLAADGTGVGLGVSFSFVLKEEGVGAAVGVASQISVMSTPERHGTVNFQPHLRPVQAQ
jgi:hypothetical protein